MMNLVYLLYVLQALQVITVMLCNWESVKGVGDIYQGVKVMNFKANTWKNFIFSYFYVVIFSSY